MSLFEVGRLAIKIAGRDAGKTCVIIDKLEDPFVLIGGQTRRRRCNLRHLEPLPQSIKIKKNASPQEIKTEFKKLGLEVLETKPKEKKERPRKQRKDKLKEIKETKKKKGAEKLKEEKKSEEKKPEETEKKEESKKDIKSSSFEETLERESRNP